MEDGLREKVGVLRERIKRSSDRSNDGRALYQELSDLLFQAGKISAAMNILERSLDSAPAEAGQAGLAGDSAGLHGEEGNEGKWLFDRGLEFADAFLYEDAVECFQQALESGP